MRKLHLPFRWQTATVFAVSCFLGGIAVSLGLHEQRVGSAVEEARAQARLLDEERTQLEETLAKARAVSEVSESVSDEDAVASAAAELTQAATSAAYAAEHHHVTVTATAVVPPAWASAPLGVETARGPFASTPSLEIDPSAVLGQVEQQLAAQEQEADDTLDAGAIVSAEPKASAFTDPRAGESESPSPSVTPSSEPTASAEPTASPSATPEATEATPAAEPTADEEAAALAEIVADTEVAKVLRGEVDDLDAVTAATAQLEKAAAQLDAATRRIEGTTAVLEAATAEAALERSNVSLENKIDAIKGLADSAKGMVHAVDGKVEKKSTLADLRAAREDLLALRDVEVDREDADAVDAVLADVEAATAGLEEAEQAVYDSHARWVRTENTRRKAVNEKRMAAYERQVDQATASAWGQYAAAAAARQAGWEGTPTGISYSNGMVPSSQLCSLSFSPGNQLQCDAAEALERADDDYYAQTGRHLSLSSSYRSYGAQVATKASKGYLAATPGTSNHGWGMAADFDPASAAWIAANGDRYGWVHPLWARVGGSKPESWHMEFVAPGITANLPSEPKLYSMVRNTLKG
ncbi:M15 family metallopeptidase [Demequina phytophila]|uniref:M15 family metallopeptidase n=1 Tax=Demequina phytophila TaxID=1638981 RepID=UPI000782F053|nr:M15 family metallopeptidase [Demequina phytophila]